MITYMLIIAHAFFIYTQSGLRINPQSSLHTNTCFCIRTFLNTLIINYFLTTAPFKPFKWLEGVSIWPSENIRLIALGYALYFIALLIADNFAVIRRINIKRHLKIKSKAKISATSTCLWFHIFVLFFVFIVSIYFGNDILTALTDKTTPTYREDTKIPDNGLFIALFLITATTAAIITIKSTELNKLKKRLETMINTQEIINAIQLTAERSGIVNNIILYPFIVASLIILSRWSYFYNWGTNPALICVLATCFVILFYHYIKFNTIADLANEFALQALRKRIIKAAPNFTSLESALRIAEQSASQPFLQHPLFQGVLLLAIAASIGYTDYSSLIMKLLN